MDKIQAIQLALDNASFAYCNLKLRRNCNQLGKLHGELICSLFPPVVSLKNVRTYIY